MNKRNLSVPTLLLFLMASPAVSQGLIETLTQPHTIITGPGSALPAPKLPGLNKKDLPTGGSGPNR
jgi:hypothetical protein